MEHIIVFTLECPTTITCTLDNTSTIRTADINLQDNYGPWTDDQNATNVVNTE